MFTESTQMYFSVIVQMSIGNERKKNSQNKPSRSSRQEMGAGGGGGHSMKVQCAVFYLRFFCYLIHALQLCSPICKNKRNKRKLHLS